MVSSPSFVLPSLINHGTKKNTRTFYNVYIPYSNEFSRKSDPGWRYWNGIIWSWTYLLFTKNVTFEITRTQGNFTQVNEKLRSIEFPDYSNHTCVNFAYRTLLASFYMQSILLRQLEPREWNLTPNIISTIKNSNNQSKELIKITKRNFNLKKNKCS